MGLTPQVEMPAALGASLHAVLRCRDFGPGSTYETWASDLAQSSPMQQHPASPLTITSVICPCLAEEVLLGARATHARCHCRLHLGHPAMAARVRLSRRGPLPPRVVTLVHRARCCNVAYGFVTTLNCQKTGALAVDAAPRHRPRSYAIAMIDCPRLTDEPQRWHDTLSVPLRNYLGHQATAAYCCLSHRGPLPPRAVALVLVPSAALPKIAKILARTVAQPKK